MSSQPTSIATRAGVVAGLILGIFSLPVVAFAGEARFIGTSGRFGIVYFVIAIITLGVASFVATRRNGKVGSGIWAAFLGALIAAFIAVCLGAVLVALLAPYAITAIGIARRAGHIVRANPIRLALARLFLAGLLLLVVGLVAGLIGSLLGLIGRPRGGSGPITPPSGAPDALGATVPYGAPLGLQPYQIAGDTYGSAPTAGGATAVANPFTAPTPAYPPEYPTPPADPDEPTVVRDPQP